jgi:hypothetical protein
MDLIYDWTAMALSVSLAGSGYLYQGRILAFHNIVCFGDMDQFVAAP